LYGTSATFIVCEDYEGGIRGWWHRINVASHPDGPGMIISITKVFVLEIFIWKFDVTYDIGQEKYSQGS